MNDQAQLYAKRISELDQLVNAHLEAGSLDEGNATAFDELIEAWLEEELIRIDLSQADRLRGEVTASRRTAAADVRAKRSADLRQSRARDRRARRSRRERRRHARRTLRAENRRHRVQRLEESRRARAAKRLAMAAERLDAATAQLRRAEHLLVVEPSRPADSAPHFVTSPPFHDHLRTEEKIA